MLRSAFGYAIRQKDALVRVLDDGRLVLDNNRSKRALRSTIATGRKAWLFVGSDDHAESAGHLFSLIASCKLHGLDAGTYLRDLFRVLAYWPKDRHIELAPKYWAKTRARLDADELARDRAAHRPASTRDARRAGLERHGLTADDPARSDAPIMRSSGSETRTGLRVLP